MLRSFVFESAFFKRGFFSFMTEYRPQLLRIERPRFNLAKEPWRSDAPLRTQLSRRPYRGEGFLFHAGTGQLLRTLTTLTQHSPDAEFIRDVAAFADKTHAHDRRKDDETPYVHHLLRGAIRLALLGANSDMLAAYLLHDTVEDHNVTLDDMKRNKYLRKYAADGRLRMLHEVATAMSIKRGTTKLDEDTYHGNIKAINDKYAHIHPWFLKGIDRDDNTKADLSLAIRHGNPIWAAELVRDYRYKTRVVMSFIETHEPGSAVIDMLTDSWNLGGELMATHGLRDTEQTTNVVRRRRPR
jgi:hypothetical protein